MHEIIVAKTGMVDEIDAFDFSEASLDLARNKASEAKVKVNFYKDDINTFSLQEKKYDMVLCSGSVHHVKELEHFYATVRNALSPQGYFVINEYVGACYNIYDDRQVKLINRLYQHFPDTMRSSKAATYENAPLQTVLDTDPSESVRSKLVLPFLKHYFNIEIYRPFGGFILHPLYPLLNDAKFLSDARSETILRLLLEFEAILMESGLFETDFALCICRPK
jgi:ubiquinone/menaquinone biosynthesis C-methylase UbiE